MGRQIVMTSARLFPFICGSSSWSGGGISNRRCRPTRHFERRYDLSSLSGRNRLLTPEVIFSNHHLLAVNKPAGWHSVPNDAGVPDSSKCLLTHLRRRRLGGGSESDFLRPLHRIDQPCTGVLLLGKNRKSAQRVQTAWKKGDVKKEYLCVVEAPSIDVLRNRSLSRIDVDKLRLGKKERGSMDDTNYDIDWGGDAWANRSKVYVLTGLLQQNRRNGGRGSVLVRPLHPSKHYSSELDSKLAEGRICSLEWRHLASFPSQSSAFRPLLHLVTVRTETGARHQVRSLLSAAGACPIAGDLRYGSDRPGLPDRSVALHARALFLPSVKLGGMEFLSTDAFKASIPIPWYNFFGLSEEEVQALEYNESLRL